MGDGFFVSACKGLGFCMLTGGAFGYLSRVLVGSGCKWVSLHFLLYGFYRHVGFCRVLVICMLLRLFSGKKINYLTQENKVFQYILNFTGIFSFSMGCRGSRVRFVLWCISWCVQYYFGLGAVFHEY